MASCPVAVVTSSLMSLALMNWAGPPGSGRALDPWSVVPLVPAERAADDDESTRQSRHRREAPETCQESSIQIITTIASVGRRGGGARPPRDGAGGGLPWAAARARRP